MRKLRTPLRYPGGKSRAMDYLLSDENMPAAEITEYRDPFTGGGSPAIAFAKQNPDIPVWINDKYYNLYSFYCSVQQDADRLVSIIIEKLNDVRSDEDKHRDLFNACKEEINEQSDQTEIAWRFYVMNRISFSGLTETSTFAAANMRTNFNENLTTDLLWYSHLMKDWKITNVDYTELLDDNESAFVFLDPPYDIKAVLYGKNGEMHTGFDHKKFCDDCRSSKNMQMITYNSNEFLREQLEGYTQIEWDLKYSMCNGSDAYEADQKNRMELLCLNYETKIIENLESFFL